MSRAEYRELPRAAHSLQAEIALRLMGDCGLRVAETLDVRPCDVSRMVDGKHHELEVVAGKDTTGEYDDGKQRRTWVPRDLEVQINRYIQEADLKDDDRLIDREKRSVQNWVSRAADAAAEETSDPDYRRVSSHDLRRCWAHHLLVEEGVSPRIVMALGGWSSYDAIEPYLAAPTEQNIIDQMSMVGL
jgi:integrase